MSNLVGDQKQAAFAAPKPHNPLWRRILLSEYLVVMLCALFISLP